MMADLQRSSKARILSPSLLLLLCLSLTTRPSMAAATDDQKETRISVKVGVILDLTSALGLLANNSITLAVEDIYSVHNDTATKIDLIVCNISQNDVVSAADQALDLIEKVKVQAILGPQNSEQARFIVKLGEKHEVPVIWFPITGPSLSPPPSPSSIYSDHGLNCLQFRAIADVIKALGWQSIVPIYEETEYGSHLIPCLTNVFKEMGIRMANVTSIRPITSDLDGTINNTLDDLKSMRSRIYLVHMNMDLGTTFIRSAQIKDMMGEGYAWILTQELSSLTDPKVNIQRKLYHDLSWQNYTYFTDPVRLKRFMQGALGVRPMDSNKTDFRRQREGNFSDRFKRTLTIYGWWAYHTIEALAKAVEKTGPGKGSILRKEILATNFTGLSGVNFSFSTKGQLDQSVLEVYNVIGDRERIIGAWSPETGLVQNYSKVGDDETSGEYKLLDPLWPGDTMDKPPKLRIGVPRTNSFPELVNVDNSSNKTKFDGFAINVFLKAVDILPFPLKNYEFVPLPIDESSNTTMPYYDYILCSETEDKELDAIIGDVTIVANRTRCVDFTLPYLDSSVVMVVRVNNATTGRGILFKPFHWSLWLILGGIFVGATIMIIMLDGNKTEEFRFNPFLVYKMDTMESFASNTAGWLVVLTTFLFILVLQVYTANLTSILTEGKERVPSFKDENEIKSSNLMVGYQRGSWVRGLLIEQVGFNESQLKDLGGREEYDKALSDGTRKGGVDAIFDETPYLTIFLSRYKSRFMMTGPIYKTGGFAFAFPKKLGLVLHFSNAILNVTQDVEPFRVLVAKSSLPTSIEDLEFEDQNEIETSSLSITNFGGLYPVLLSVAALLLGLSILNPRVIEWLRKKMVSILCSIRKA
ncbi:glutamate receptor 2.7-like [Prosopis cineraria]|uniref:glutamate receptor 2.7-like n=1 Tax=Prosopis cineraria TaxID=364024 RepID=UPI00241014B5|nr:glutamate receptor 2.7-like [Prosopis cineraria]